MSESDKVLHAVAPSEVLKEIAVAIPEDCKKNLTIIGSLAVGYRYFSDQKEMVVRTKDADCLLSPRVNAVQAGTAITERLLDEKWRIGKSGEWTEPGTENTPDKELPAVRLEPPTTSQWFMELLTVPESTHDEDKQWLRLETRYGHFGLPSFRFLGLTNVDPISTVMGLFIARPEMMALANLLEHPEIKPDTMSGGFAGRTDIKRSNKDLGRVLAIARLAEREDENVLMRWPKLWEAALKTQWPNDWRTFAKQAGEGLKQLMDSDRDLEQARFSCANGLLASNPPSAEVLKIAGQRLFGDAIDPLKEAAL